MKKFLKFAALVILTVAFLLPKNSFASVEADALEELCLLDHQIAAVSIDMALYLGWMPELKEEMKKAADKAKIDLNQFKNQLDQLSLPEAMNPLRVKDSAVIDKLLSLYDGVEKKSPEAIDAEFAQFNALYSEYSKQIKDALEKYGPKIQGGQEFDVSSETAKLITDTKGKQIYLYASQLVQDEERGKAYKYFKDLAQKYKNTPAEAALSIPLSDCLFSMDESIQTQEGQGGVDVVDQGLKLLSDTMDRNEYSPMLYNIFLQWRTKQQGSYGGMSNSSEIANLKYNEKRYRVYRTLKKYLQAHPEDQRAKEQVVLIIGLPNIERGGAYGNSALTDLGAEHSEEVKKWAEKQKAGQAGQKGKPQ